MPDWNIKSCGTGLLGDVFSSVQASSDADQASVQDTLTKKTRRGRRNGRRGGAGSDQICEQALLPIQLSPAFSNFKQRTIGELKSQVDGEQPTTNSSMSWASASDTTTECGAGTPTPESGAQDAAPREQVAAPRIHCPGTAKYESSARKDQAEKDDEENEEEVEQEDGQEEGKQPKPVMQVMNSSAVAWAAPESAAAPTGWPAASTTVVIKNVPNRCLAEELLSHFCQEGFQKLMDFFYLPADFQSKRNRGYAFTNLVSAEAAIQFCSTYHGRKVQKHSNEKILECLPALDQGFCANVRKHHRGATQQVKNPWFAPMVFQHDVAGSEMICVPLCSKSLPPWVQRRLETATIAGGERQASTTAATRCAGASERSCATGETSCESESLQANFTEKTSGGGEERVSTVEGGANCACDDFLGRAPGGTSPASSADKEFRSSTPDLFDDVGEENLSGGAFLCSPCPGTFSGMSKSKGLKLTVPEAKAATFRLGAAKGQAREDEDGLVKSFPKQIMGHLDKTAEQPEGSSTDPAKKCDRMLDEKWQRAAQEDVILTCRVQRGSTHREALQAMKSQYLQQTVQIERDAARADFKKRSRLPKMCLGNSVPSS